MTNERVITDINLSASLSQIAESTTAAELVRTQGQTKKVKVLSERKLTEWITALLSQHLAAKEDTFSDHEKEEVLRKVQEELAKRIQREQNAERERAKAQSELELVMSQISQSNGDRSSLEAALNNLRTQLNDAENARTELEQDTYELQDELQEKLNLLSTTIAEKDKLRDALRTQMMRSNTLVEAVLGIDSNYYANRHAEDNPVADDTADDERFFHDYDVGVQVIQTLIHDLETLRSITDRLGDGSGDARSLAQDIELLAEVKSGSLHAIDVAAPVSGLIEALAGAQAEAHALDEVVCQATGSQPRPLSALPDADGEPGVVIAGATTVARELAAEFARDRQRVLALVNLADEADQARNQVEEELAEARAAIPTTPVVPIADFKIIAQSVVTAAHSDPALADSAADLAVGLDPENHPEPDYAAQIAQTITQLGERKNALQTELATKQQRLAAAEQRIAEVSEQLRSAQAETAASAQRLAAAEQRIAEVNEQLRTAQAETLAKAQRVAAAEQCTAEVNELLRTAQAETVAKAQRVAAAEQRIAEINEQLRSVQAETIAAAQRLAAAEQRTAEVNEQLRSAQAQTAETVTKWQASDQLKSAVEQELEQALESLLVAAATKEELHLVRVQAKQADEEAQAARAEVAATSAKLRELELRHAERIRTDKVLAGELLQVAKQDDLLADVTSDLSVALDDELEPSELQQQLTRTVTALAQRQQALSAENSALGKHSERLRAEIGEAKRNLAETQRAVLESVIQVSKNDGDLADSVHQLEWALEQMRPGEPLPIDLLATLDQALSKLAGRKQELQAERDDLALNSKEIISALSATRDQREQELKIIRQEHDEVADRLGMLESRAAAAESANRDLAEALSQAAVNLNSPESEEARIDLELALSQLPGDGEDNIDIPADVTTHIAAHGTRLVQSMAAAKKLADSQYLAVAQALAAAKTDLDRQQEVQLAQADEIALCKAEADGHRTRIANLERQLALSQADVAGFTASGGASTSGMREEINSLRQALAKEQDQVKARELAMAEIRENLLNAEARHQHMREELTRRLTERDQLIQDKDRELDALAENRAQISGLEAQIATLTAQVEQANARIAELSTATGVHASITTKHSNIGLELKRTQAERDQLRAQQLALQGDLADANAKIHVLQSMDDEKRKELLAIRVQIQQTLDLERRKTATLTDEVGQLKAEKIGLEHKLRKLTGEL